MFDAKSLVDDATHLSILMEWIESARHILFVTDWVNSTNPAFGAMCQKAGIPINNAPWDVEQSDALLRLATLQRGMLRSAAELLEQAERGANA